LVSKIQLKKLGIQILIAAKKMIERILQNVRRNKRVVGLVETVLKRCFSWLYKCA